MSHQFIHWMPCWLLDAVERDVWHTKNISQLPKLKSLMPVCSVYHKYMDSRCFLLIWNRTCTLSKTHLLYLLNTVKQLMVTVINFWTQYFWSVCECTLVVSQLQNPFHAWRSVNEWFYLYLVKRPPSHPDSQAADNHPNGLQNVGFSE